MISDSGAAINSGADFCTAFPLLLGRTWREFTRNKFELLLQIGMSSFFAALFGLIYFRLDRDQTSIMDRSGLLFFQAMNGCVDWSVHRTGSAGALSVARLTHARRARRVCHREDRAFGSVINTSAALPLQLQVVSRCDGHDDDDDDAHASLCADKLDAVLCVATGREPPACMGCCLSTWLPLSF